MKGEICIKEIVSNTRFDLNNRSFTHLVYELLIICKFLLIYNIIFIYCFCLSHLFVLLLIFRFVCCFFCFIIKVNCWNISSNCYIRGRFWDESPKVLQPTHDHGILGWKERKDVLWQRIQSGRLLILSVSFSSSDIDIDWVSVQYLIRLISISIAIVGFDKMGYQCN